MGLRCYLLGHKWEPKHVYHSRDTLYNGCAPSTVVTSKCIVCGEVRDKVLYGAGYVELKELQHEPNK
jgi:hypothetical protein